LSPRSSKNKLQHIQLDTTGSSKETKETNQRKSFLAANPPDGINANRDKTTPCPRLNILLFFLAGGPGHLVQIYGF